MTASILQKIGSTVQQRIDDLKKHTSLEQIKSLAKTRGYFPQDFVSPFLEKSDVNVIAEYKRASPSKGDIAPDLGALDVAEQYLDAGAKALSVLTEPSYFKGDLQFIRDIRAGHPEARILMKDFFVDEYQLYQALEAGADAILVIVGLLGKERSKTMADQAKTMGLYTLVEVHDEAELEIALGIKADLIGINNRDLRDLSISLGTSKELIKKIPEGKLAISESGIESNDDIRHLQDCGFSGFLVGTSLMRTGAPGKALRELIGN